MEDKKNNDEVSNSSHKGYVDNPHLEGMTEDILYHLNISTSSHDLKTLFGDVKFVCMGGTAGRMYKYAQYFSKELSSHISPDEPAELKNYTGSTDRYVIYKVGPVITASHGVGVPSMSILMMEIFKLLTHAGASGVTFFRLGTCGGLGLDPGSLVVTTEPLNGELRPVYEQFILGERTTKPAALNQDLVEELRQCHTLSDSYQVVPGKTLCANDFYEAQGRTDGAICAYTEEDKRAFVKKLHDIGVRNIEMECVGFAAFTHHVRAKAAVVCVTLLNRLIDDQIRADKPTLMEYEMRPAQLVAKYMLKQLNQN